MLLEYHDHLCYVLLQFNNTALHYTARDGKINAINYLINNGARLNDVTDVS